MDEFSQEISRSDYELKSTSAISQEDASSNEVRLPNKWGILISRGLENSLRLNKRGGGWE